MSFFLSLPARHGVLFTFRARVWGGGSDRGLDGALSCNRCLPCTVAVGTSVPRVLGRESRRGNGGEEEEEEEEGNWKNLGKGGVEEVRIKSGEKNNG